jgi:hypothetical protein
VQDVQIFAVEARDKGSRRTKLCAIEVIVDRAGLDKWIIALFYDIFQLYRFKLNEI